MRSIDGLALGDQAGDHQAGRGAQVGRHHGRARAAASTPLHDRGVALDLDVRAQAQQLVHVHEAVLEDRLGDHARCRRRSQSSAMNCACMSVGKPGIRRGAHVDRARAGRRRARGCQSSPRVDRRAGLAQLVDAPRRGGRRAPCAARTSPPVAATAHEERAGLDAVGHDRVRRRRAARSTPSMRDRGRAGALDLRAHRDQAARRGRRPPARARRSRAPSRPRRAPPPSSGSRCR